MVQKMALGKIAALFCLLMFFVYLSTLSISLDDWDSVQFALGLKEFNVAKHQPHPPGFPLYILFGTLLNALLKNELLSLTCLSAFFGALSIFALYQLAKEMFNKQIALAASILTAITPMFWMYSVKAMSDMPALFFTLTAILFIFKYVKYKKTGDLYAASLLSAVSAGVRPYSAVLLFPLLVCAVFLRRKSAKNGLKALSVFAFATLAWFLPLILISGITEYFSSTDLFFKWVFGNPVESIVSAELTLDYLGGRVFSFLKNFLLGGYGINLQNLSSVEAILLFFIAGLLVCSLKKFDRKDERIILFASALAPYLLMVFTFFPYYNDRYLLIGVPLLSMIFANSIWRFKKTNQRLALFCVLGGLLLYASLPLALEIHTKPTPPLQLINYLNENYGSGDFIVLVGDEQRHFDYYPTAISKIPEVDCKKISQLLAENKTALCLYNINCPGLKLKLVSAFERNPRVHLKHSSSRLYEFSTEDGG